MNKKILVLLAGPVILVLLSVAIYVYRLSSVTINTTVNQVENQQTNLPASGEIKNENNETITTNEIVPVNKVVESNEKNVQEVKDLSVAEEESNVSFVAKVIDFILPDTIDAEGVPLKINYEVPFTSQAPNGEWDDDRYQDGCEEASVMMAYYWTQGKVLTKDIATKEIANMAEWEVKQWGSYHDSSVADTKRLFTEYFKYSKVESFYDVGVEDIKKALQEGGIVIIPADGQKLNNPYFTPPGPPIHMLVIRGYDENKKEFITNDPGTKRGAEFRYSYNTILTAWRDYPTGYHLPITEIRTAMLVVKK